jgi:hypothetical protein
MFYRRNAIEMGLLYQQSVSLDVRVGNLELGVALEDEEEADVLIGQVEDGVVVLAYSAQVVLLHEEVHDGVDGQIRDEIGLRTLVLTRRVQELAG